MGGETRVSPLIAHGPFMGSVGIVRGSGRGRAFSCGIERACGCPRCLICTEASGFSHFRPNCTHRQGPPPGRGPAAALPGIRWWVAVTVRCDISSTIFPTIRVCVMYEEGIGNIEAYLCLFTCLYLFNVYLDERTYRGEWKHCVVSSDWEPESNTFGKSVIFLGMCNRG